MEYRLYIFLVNYRYLQDVYKKDLEIQFDNIKQLIIHELGALNYEMTSSDNRSLTFKDITGNSFKNVFKMASYAESVISRLRSLLKDFQGELFIKPGIITLEEEDKRHAFKWSFNYDEIKSLPDILLTDKTAFSIIENYDVSFTGLKNIWHTKGIEISRAQRIRKLYFNRDEENGIEDFINKPYDENVLFVYGDKGSGKSCMINEAVKRSDNSGIIFLREKKQSTREFKVLHELMYDLLFVNRYKDVAGIDDVISAVQNSSLQTINKDNLTCLIRMLFGDICENGNILFCYGDYRTSLKTALDDCLKITQRKTVVIIDDHQWMSRNCEELLLGLIDHPDRKLRLILVSDDKNNSNNIKIPVRFLKVSEINKVQISKLLQMAYPHTKISGKTADFIHRVTEGNLYTAVSYIEYLIEKDAITVNDGKVELRQAEGFSVPDNLSDIYTEKLNSLSENAVTLLKIVSIIGEQFYNSDLDWLLHTINYPFDEAAGLAELEEKGMISNNGDFYSINEPSLISGIYKTVKDPNKKLLHKLLAELFETKGYEDFGFKVFFHSYRAEDYEKLLPLLPELIAASHSRLHFAALRNMLEISDKLLFKLCMKDNLYPPELWLKNLMSTKWLFDRTDPADHIKRFEKAVEYLEKIGKKELSADLYEILIGFYIESGKFKKAESALNTAVQTAEEKDLKHSLYQLLILKTVNLIKTGRTIEAAAEFERTEQISKEAGVKGESDYYVFARAMYLYNNGEVRQALELLKSLLDKFSLELNFGRISSILKLLIELSIRARDYKSAEDYCKFMLSSGKDQNDENNTITGNILLARLYSYQNKFLQSISILESVAASVKNRELYYEALYLLGSIYQFFGETEMSEKTFKTALEKIKDSGSDLYLKFSFKLALLYAYTDDFEKSNEFLKKCAKAKFFEAEMLFKIINYKKRQSDDSEMDMILKELYSTSQSNNKDLLFETELVLLKILYSKRKYQACRELSDRMNTISGQIEDYNLTLEFNKFSKILIKSTYKTRRAVSEKTKVSPSVRKRVRNRRSI
ncbi:MAG TPA: AAA family ATPase [Clostridiales bacterium]|jgi:tetratricopeptide (TPR) repeat protein|nr:AAA family ATPase [Clostridiales bacterium]HQP70018.1 AAA family ATPase [Clostridiales bacterium]